jgi:hypothetical protein
MSLTKVTYSMLAGSPINVLDYGASPSASASVNRAAIQAALDQGGLVLLPKGVYQIDDTLFFPRGTFLSGEGMIQSALEITDNTKPVITIDQTKSTGFAVRDTGIAQMRITGGSVGIEFGKPATTNWGPDCLIDRVWLYQNGRGAVVNNAWQLYFFKCLFDQNFTNNLLIASRTAPAFQNTTWFEQCDFTNCTGPAQVVIDHEVIYTTTFNNCIWEGGSGNPATVGLQVTSSFISSLRLLNCYFEDHLNYFVEVVDSNSNGGNEIVGCTFLDRSGRTAPIISTLNGFVVSTNYITTNFGSTAIEGGKRSTFVNNKITSTGTNNLSLSPLANFTGSIIEDDPLLGAKYPRMMIGQGASGPTSGIVSTSKIVPGTSSVDVALCKFTDNNSSGILEITASGVSVLGGVAYFKGVRHVLLTAGTSITTTTLGTDASSNSSITLTWVSLNTFKVTLNSGLGSDAGYAVSVNVLTGGGADGAATGAIEFLSLL